MGNKKKYLIREFTEFNLQRMNSDSTQMATHVDNPSLASDAFDRHVDALNQANLKLNTILKGISPNQVYQRGSISPVNVFELENVTIQRIFKRNEVDLDIHMTFVLGEKEYFATIESFIFEPKLKSEILNDSDIHLHKEAKIKLEGLLIKLIKQWMVIKRGEYKALEDIKCISYDSGEQIVIKKNSVIKVYRTIHDAIVIDYTGIKCKIQGMNYFFFNYYFERLQ